MRRSLCGSSFVLLCIFPRLANGFIATAVSRVGCLARRGVIASLPKSSENNVRLGVHDQQRVSRTTVMGSRGESRSDALKRVGFSIAGALAISISPSNAAARTTEELVQLVRDSRRQLDPVDGLISDAKWDAIRNTIKTKPLADVKNIIAELARQADEDDSPLLLGMRQDVLDHVQYLDSFSYNNVFIGEERQILGTKIDFDTPRMELRQCREAFDLILEVLPSPE